MPLSSELTVDQLITDFSRAYMNAEFMAEKVLPAVPTRKMRGLYATYGKDSIRTANIPVLSSDTAIAESVTYTVGKDSYALGLYRLSDIIGTLEREEADLPFQPEQDTTEHLMQLIGIDKEVRFATQVFGSTNFATGNKTALTASTYWSNYSAATGIAGPVHQVHSGINVVRGKALAAPRVMAIGAVVETVLRRHPDIRDSLKFVQTLSVMNIDAAMASIFGVQEFHVIRTVKNTAVKGDADSLSDVVGKKACLLVRPATPTRKSVAHSIQLRRSTFPNGDKWVVRERMGATMVEVRDAYVFKTVDSSAGYLFDTTQA